jgi:hypothetical protein
MAVALAELVETCRPLEAMPDLAENAMQIARGELWPTPHDGRFDFPGTTAGAEWIDDVARHARMVLDGSPSGDRVIGHTDWRAQNMRFADGRVAASYDWDSLAIQREPALVGSAAHAFTSNWADPPDTSQFPSLNEATAFISDYESGRGRVFTSAEHRAARAALAYSMAYTARCEHSDALTDFGRNPPAVDSRDDIPADEAKTFLANHATDLLAED